MLDPKTETSSKLEERFVRFKYPCIAYVCRLRTIPWIRGIICQRIVAAFAASCLILSFAEIFENPLCERYSLYHCYYRDRQISHTISTELCVFLDSNVNVQISSCVHMFDIIRNMYAYTSNQSDIECFKAIVYFTFFRWNTFSLLNEK